MLVLSRKPSQQIVVGSDIRITVVRIERNQVRIGIQAPPGMRILRHELTRKRPLVLGDSPSEIGRTGSEQGLHRPRRARDSRRRVGRAGIPTAMNQDS